MVKLTLGANYWNRSVPQEFLTPLKNRFLEQNPASITGVSAVLRAGLKRYLNVGPGPIRCLYSEPGSFDDALFVASGKEVHKVSTDNTSAKIGDILTDTASVIMTATGNIGETPAYLFLTDGQGLYVYAEDGFAHGTLSAFLPIVDGYQIEINGTYYQWTAGSVDAGTPAGTLAFPWLVAMGADTAAAIFNMFRAINGTGEIGVTYSTALTINTDAVPTTYDATSFSVRAISPGVIGNAITTTAPVSGFGDIAWTSTTLIDGGDASFSNVPIPDEKAVVSVATLASYVIVVIGPNQGENGRFYWIEPGETIIRPLNFATAEQAPDATLQSLVLGDTIMFFGQTTTETWYASGNTAAPFQRAQGNVFSRGAWEGTAVKIRDTLMIVDATGIVYAITGGAPAKVSNAGVEQLLRQAIMQQRG